MAPASIAGALERVLPATAATCNHHRRLGRAGRQPQPQAWHRNGSRTRRAERAGQGSGRDPTQVLHPDVRRQTCASVVGGTRPIHFSLTSAVMWVTASARALERRDTSSYVLVHPEFPRFLLFLVRNRAEPLPVIPWPTLPIATRSFSPSYELHLPPATTVKVHPSPICASADAIVEFWGHHCGSWPCDFMRGMALLRSMDLQIHGDVAAPMEKETRKRQPPRNGATGTTDMRLAPLETVQTRGDQGSSNATQ